VPARVRVDAYPVAERYGLVFAFLGDLPEAERCPIMDIPEYMGEKPDAGWAATIQHFEWNFNFQRSIENGIDGAHNEYVHPTHGFSGEREDLRTPSGSPASSAAGACRRWRMQRCARPRVAARMR
jgi:phenylpropionate dioxygenase-like ring-hydroxylating dioxygenase large terminal subunit